MLNVDMRLFIDPLLLAHSAHPKMLDGARTYKEHFDRVIRLLVQGSRRNGGKSANRFRQSEGDWGAAGCSGRGETVRECVCRR